MSLSGGGWRLLFFFQAEDGIRDLTVTGVQTCALPIFQDAEVGGVAQVIVLPGVAVEQEGIEAGVRHGLGKTRPAMGKDRGHAGSVTPAGSRDSAGASCFAACFGETTPAAMSRMAAAW